MEKAEEASDYYFNFYKDLRTKYENDIVVIDIL